MVVDVILNILLQLLYLVGSLIVFGLFIALCNRVVFRLLGSKSRAFVIVTGIIGTPLHELSHAAMCVIFGHKITQMKLFTPMSEDGTLGYVRHSYNKRNVYHVIGNYFIGVAPIFSGALILMFLLWLLVPGAFHTYIVSVGNIDPSAFFGSTFKALGGFLGEFFSVASLSHWGWWVLLILGMSIALHMELSFADMRGAVPGLVTIIGLSIVINIIVALVGMQYSQAMTRGIAYFGVYLVGIMIIAAVFAVLLSLIAAIIKLIQIAIGSIVNRRRS